LGQNGALSEMVFQLPARISLPAHPSRLPYLSNV
jgi:hypothetical protein